MQAIQVPIEQAFGALGDPTRMRLMRLLVVTGDEICLCEFVDSLLEPQYKLSRHLKILRQAGLLHVEKEGRWIYHRLASDPKYLQDLFSLVATLPDPTGAYKADRTRFVRRLRYREDGRCRVGVLSKALSGASD